MVVGNSDPPTCLIKAVKRAKIEAEIKANRDSRRALGIIQKNKSAEVKFGWPARQADHALGYGVNGISNFVDLNSNYPYSMLYYNYGIHPYDLVSGYNHQGTNVFSWSNSWLKMDNDNVEVVAAAPGVIVDWQDGYN